MSTLAVGTIKSVSSAAPVFQNTSGTEKGQLAKVWINFNGTGTVAIRDSFNVSSITDNGTGNYTVTIDNDMSNANYSVVTGGNRDTTNSICVAMVKVGATPAAGSFLLLGGDSDFSFHDYNFVFASVFGD
tara:strand:+ start:129 stop:518 length:390 start_codon:yes stop_codon:yes gene_type:complete